MKEQILIDALERIKEMTNFPERISADNGMLRLSAINLIIEAALSQFHSTGKEKGLKWVSVEKELPPKSEKYKALNCSEAVLVISDDVVDAVPRVTYWNFGWGRWDDEGCGSHWLPVTILPEPPKL